MNQPAFEDCRFVRSGFRSDAAAAVTACRSDADAFAVEEESCVYARVSTESACGFLFSRLGAELDSEDRIEIMK